MISSPIFPIKSDSKQRFGYEKLSPIGKNEVLLIKEDYSSNSRRMRQGSCQEKVSPQTSLKAIKSLNISDSPSKSIFEKSGFVDSFDVIHPELYAIYKEETASLDFTALTFPFHQNNTVGLVNLGNTVL
jgi:hypothetical protein